MVVNLKYSLAGLYTLLQWGKRGQKQAYRKHTIGLGIKSREAFRSLHEICGGHRHDREEEQRRGAWLYRAELKCVSEKQQLFATIPTLRDY